ncbi:MAG TPA: S41 family peptidase [Clostridia bacterium]|nr:S41 family peptidase [Clostridia bacterium]
MRSWQRTTLYFLAVILITAAVTAGVTVSIMNRNAPDTVVMSVEEYSKLREVLVFREIMDKIASEALHSDIDRKTLVETGARGMLSALNDTYAEYYTAEEYEAYLSRINGEYNGIGILVGQPDEIGAQVLDVYEDNPADIAGVQTGDIITAVDGKSMAGVQLDELVAAVDVAIGETVNLTILRGTQTLELPVTSAAINIKRVSYALFKEHTGYIRLDMFTGNCVDEFEEALRNLNERGMKSLVIDLRNNPGGSLDDVVEIADMLLGDCTIVSLKGNDSEDDRIFTSKGQPLKVPLAILVNENSASASEILAGAIQDNNAGMVVGMKTFGKGIVQTTMPLESNGSWLKMTTEEYFTPSGVNIHGVGITPDIIVDLPADMKGTPIDQINQEKDAQLWEALDYVRAEANK